MRKLYVTVDTGYVGVDLKFPFDVDDDATPEEIRDYAEEALQNQISWNVEDENGEEVDVWW